MEIVETILSKNPCYKTGKKIEVKGLMLHSLCSPQPSAKVLTHNWNRPSCDNRCPHAFVDGNTGVVYQTLPWNHRGRHCGRHSETKQTGNDAYIGVEMCEPPKVRYTKKGLLELGDWTKDQKSIEIVSRTYQAAVELFAYLCKKFDLDPKTDILSHKEGYEHGIASNRGDPEHLWEAFGLPYTMDGFRSDVKTFMDTKAEADEIPEPVSLTIKEVTASKTEEIKTEPIEVPITPEPIRVRIDVENLRIRSGPGTEYNPTGKYTGVGVFSIEEIQNGSGSTKGWGKLANGAGWVCLDYTTPT